MQPGVVTTAPVQREIDRATSSARGRALVIRWLSPVADQPEDNGAGPLQRRAPAGPLPSACLRAAAAVRGLPRPPAPASAVRPAKTTPVGRFCRIAIVRIVAAQTRLDAEQRDRDRGQVVADHEQHAEPRPATPAASTSRKCALPIASRYCTDRYEQASSDIAEPEEGEGVRRLREVLAEHDAQQRLAGHAVDQHRRHGHRGDQPERAQQDRSRVLAALGPPRRLRQQVQARARSRST